MMTQRVVDRFKVVQINENQRGITAVAGITDDLLQAFHQACTVGQVSERIGVGELVDPDFRLLALGNVVVRTDEVGHVAIIILDRRDSQPFWKHRAVFAHIPDFPLPDPAVADGLPHLAVKGIVVAARPEYARVLPHQLFGRVAGVLGECPINPQNHTACIGDHHGLLSIEGGSRDAQVLFGQFALVEFALPALVKLPAHARQQGGEQHRNYTAEQRCRHEAAHAAMISRQLLLFGQSDNDRQRKTIKLACTGVAPHAVPGKKRNRDCAVFLTRGRRRRGVLGHLSD